MRKHFLGKTAHPLTVMIQCERPDDAVERIRRSLALGADAFGLQTEWLQDDLRHADTYRQMFELMQGKPCYVTHYRIKNQSRPYGPEDFRGQDVAALDETLADGLRTLAKSGAALVDVMGDMFCPHPDQLTDDAQAVRRQMALIDDLHAIGTDVLMSSHLFRFAPAERVLEIAFEQKRRGADIIKIVTFADFMEQQLENLRITALLKRELGAPFLFLSGGESSLHRRLGFKLGCCMTLCAYEHDERSTPAQPLLTEMQTIRDSLHF
ncbi:MAG: type I 3-dehydroquinate dehydratase [Clostridia bacterium]|nr:type I 3-dehydroquinate dehydratase [Clostridia bacterium]